MDSTAKEFVERKMTDALNAFHDAFGVPRVGREPDYLNGRWCIKCENSLPDDHTGPCDVCGYEPKPLDFSGMMYADVAVKK